MKRILMVLAGFFLFSEIAEGGEVLRIMPLGDSITHGVGYTGPGEKGGGYRGFLREKLTRAGYLVDYVGTSTVNPGTLVESGDVQHEGHSGWTISQPKQRAWGKIGIYEHMEGWLKRIAPPDVVLVHIGTNDTGYSDFEHAINRFDKLIGLIAEKLPKARIIVSNLMKRRQDRYAMIEKHFNPFVQEVVRSHQKRGHHVHFVDMNAKVPLDDLPDKLHPGREGYIKMADAWFEAISAIIPVPFQIVENSLAASAGSVTLRLSMPADPATLEDPRNYRMKPACEIVSIRSEKGGREVLLTFREALKRGVRYTLSVQDLHSAEGKKRMSPYEGYLMVPASQGVENNVPPSEYSSYKLLYSIDLPQSCASYTDTVPYQIDNSRSVKTFSRVAYYLELKRKGRGLEYIWASMDSFTDTPDKVGIPVRGTGVSCGMAVNNLKVWTNSGHLESQMQGRGRIEFHPANYTWGPAFEGDREFNHHDRLVPNGGYGCMQLFDSTGKTLFAYNAWGGSRSKQAQDIGIGPCLIGNGRNVGRDWTFAKNSGQYEIRRLQVYVK